jgi:hypothetical protein
VFFCKTLLFNFSDERYEGNRLIIPQVVEDDMGGYLCIANNKVPPAMSKRVFMYVQCKFVKIFLYYFQ